MYIYIYIYYKLKYVPNEIGRILIQLDAELAKKNLTRLANSRKQSFILLSVYLVPFCPSLNLYLPLLSENDSEWLIVIEERRTSRMEKEEGKKKNGRRREEARAYERWDSCVTAKLAAREKRRRERKKRTETGSSFYRRSWLAWSWRRGELARGIPKRKVEGETRTICIDPRMERNASPAN